MLDALGVDLKEIIFVIVNFLILVFVLGKFLYKPFLEVLEKRKETIQASFDRADEKNAEADRRLAEYKKTLSDAEAEGREIISRAKERADEQADIIIREAREEAARIVSSAQKDIERERILAATEMKDEIGKLAVLAAEKIIMKEIDLSGHDRLIEQAIEEGADRWQN